MSASTATIESEIMIVQSAFIIALKGGAMGAANVIPGVSGGTVAFITGIYERLINAIKSVETTAALVDRLEQEYLAARTRLGLQTREAAE